ncbi:hypothetical protein BDY19DRAFT_901921 [Irpex rosettiformis]|uniref:Uncharacterized protein n=1 Tax=Irpex rosettiformis TaxID=378272 RepID=A0ACB8UM20_9APHY|nr:hypothetical protein BDY19DRAFT_901921 [Irpex rosettiformis]
MSDPRFAKLKTDPRFRRIRKKEAKVVLDDRFKSILDEGDGKRKKKGGKGKGRVDKYGRPLSDTHEQDNLRRFYRLENEDGEQQEDAAPKLVVDYARGAVLLESSDEEEAGEEDQDAESDNDGFVALGRDSSRPILLANDEAEIDLDEDNFADLDAQAAAYAKEHEEDEAVPETDRTRRLAVVNLDWDHVKAIHLYKVFSSLVSPTVTVATSKSRASNDKQKTKGSVSRVVRGKVLSVRVYPSEFGKERLAREEKEGPPVELFKTNDGDEDDEDGLIETNNGEDYNEAALRKYQLERLRYYYAIVECNSVEAASHLYDELEGTELERSANVFDLSFVPEDMKFEDEFRDEATEDLNAPYKGLEFVTDALRHSRVKLTWDEDDPERTKLTRRTLTRKEIDENDFKAYIASSSESETEDDPSQSKKTKNRDRIRALLLSGGDDALPEGWNKGDSDEGGDTNMEITFTPGLSESKAKGEGDETTLEKYQRKMKEKKRKRKEEQKEKKEENKKNKKGVDDDFFAADEDDSEEDSDVEGEVAQPQKTQSTAEEFALIAASDNPNGEVKHFSMKAVLQAEKSKGRKGKKKKSKSGEDEQEAQDDFAIDVKDDRFEALHEDHTFAIDPSNPHYKKTKSMSALLEERTKRQHKKQDGHVVARTSASNGASQPNLKSLVERVKRKSAGVDGGIGKRRKY